MKTRLTACFFLLFTFLFSALSAQSPSATADGFEKKVIITKRSTDANGDEVTETLIKKGKAAENFDADQYLRDNRKDNVQIEIKVVEGPDQLPARAGRAWKNDNWSFNWNNVRDELDTRAFLGVEEDSDEKEDERGLVVEVVRGSAADKAGLRDNDMILQMNGKAINRWSDLTEFVRDAKPGTEVNILYDRNGKEMTAKAVLTTRADVEKTEVKPHGFLGVSEMDYEDEGAKVSITKNSGAEKAGLRTGDVIVKLDDTDIRDYEDIVDFMDYTTSGAQVRVEYERNGKRNTTTATLGEQQSWSWNWDNGFPNLVDCDIAVKQKDACLGVYTDTDEMDDTEGARIDAFTKESAAKEVQLAPNDLIVSIEGTRVRNSDELWEEIAKFKPGQTVAVEYLRESKRATVKATLKACRDNSSRVTIQDTDAEGNNQRRSFTTWSWTDKEEKQLRQQQVIPIRRGEGDAQQVKVSPEQLAAPNRQLTLESFKAYPNPSSGQITVEFKSEPVATIVSLFDLSGRQLFREELNAFSGSYKQQFDLSDYAKGSLLIHIQQSEKVYTEQLVVN
jgi:serine protease Do